MTHCGVCGKPRNQHQPCAVCFATNATTRLCDYCRKDPLNAGWGETWEQIGGEDDISITLTTVDWTLAEIMDTRYNPTTLESRILRLKMKLDRVDKHETVQRIDAKGRKRGMYRRPVKPPTTTREIAREVKCSQAMVARVLIKWKKLLGG